MLRKASSKFLQRHFSSNAAQRYAIQKLLMPSLSPTMESGMLLAWEKKHGDKIEAGDVIAKIKTDKAVVDFEAQENGFLAKILVQQDENKEVKQIAIVCETQAEIAQAAQMVAEEKPKAAPITQQQAPAVQQQAPATVKQQEHSAAVVATSKLMGPAVRLLLAEKHLNAKDVRGSGRNGQILKGDILAHVKNGKGQVAPSTTVATKPAQQVAAPKPTTAAYEDVPTTQTRRVIANRLLESKQTIPHFYMNILIRIDRLMQVKNVYQEKGIKLSVNDFIIYFAAKALEKVPSCNSVFNKANNEHQAMKNIDISIAVATPGGLITPIIKNTNQKSIDGIAAEVKELSKRAKENKLKPEEFQGGTFCISNLGMFGITQFEAVINPPHAVILSIGATQKKVVVPQPDAGKDLDDALFQDVKLDQVQFGSYMSVTANCDGRAVDSSDAAKFLATMKEMIENL